jgi:hypothetical protein
VLLLLSTPALAAPPAEGDGWESVSNDDGIEVWQRPVEGTSLVEFRGKAVLEVGVKTILAVLHDDKRKTEWMQNCVENRIVRAWEVGRRRVYNRIGSEWPFIDDRDVVVETKLEWWADERRILIQAWNVSDDLQPEVDGVVRMPKIVLAWELVVLDAGKTQVTYQVQADPGGSIPKWLVNLASKAIPHHTLANLRTQAKKDYDASLAVVEASFDWTTVGL